mmetsp:Transcript_65195/g.205965  ORF Transcript_65195/g.205965 Transcript_65195/m.205965 type:complete len:325 (-) Transcript_65195:26-1000(-)
MATQAPQKEGKVRKFLTQHTLRDVLDYVKSGAKHEVVSIPTTMTVGDALATLRNCRILSAPLCATDPEAPEEPPYFVSVVGVDDILREFLVAFSECHPDVWSGMKDYWKEGTGYRTSVTELCKLLEELGPAFASRRMSTVTLGGRNIAALAASEESGPTTQQQQKADYEGLFKGQLDVPLLDIIKQGFLRALDPSESFRAAHRIIVFDYDDSILDVASQSDVIRFIAANAEHLGDDQEAPWTVGSLSLDMKKVFVIHGDTPAFEAFALLMHENLSGAAIVNDQGNLLANISTSDFRHVTPEQFGALALPVVAFLGSFYAPPPMV